MLRSALTFWILLKFNYADLLHFDHVHRIHLRLWREREKLNETLAQLIHKVYSAIATSRAGSNSHSVQVDIIIIACLTYKGEKARVSVQ